MADAWNPNQYERFKDERTQPFRDLLALVEPVPGGRAIDLGCGTGELTKTFHESKQLKATIGLDNSEAMLEKSAAFAGHGLTFKLGTILRFAPRKPLDIIFSNAALQWVGDHPKLFERLADGLAEGGQLSIQMPANHDHPSHINADAIAREEPFATELDGFQRVWGVLPPEDYATILFKLGFRDINVRVQIYSHQLPSRDDVVEWVKGTYLTVYQGRLSEESYAAYLERYRERLREVLPQDEPYLYCYKRILIHARKA